MSKFTLIYFKGCPNIEKARSLLVRAGIQGFTEVVQDDLPENHPLRRFSSPSILGKTGELILGERCNASSAACTFSSSNEAIVRLKRAMAAEKSGLRAILSPLAGTGGSLGLLTLIGACSGSCSLLALPITGFLASMGLGVLAPWLSHLRYPLLGMALIFACLSLFRIHRAGYRWGSVVAAVLLGGLITMSFAANQNSNCAEKAQGTAKYLRSLSPETQEVVKTGIYRSWIRLGRAPTLDEIQTAVGSGGGGRSGH